jgi:hypothetical protein
MCFLTLLKGLSDGELTKELSKSVAGIILRNEMLFVTVWIENNDRTPIKQYLVDSKTSTATPQLLP